MNKHVKFLAIFAMSVAASMPSLFAQLNIQSDGSDLDLIISTNKVIDLGKAVNGNWSDTSSPSNAGKGIYDSNKWAVVFKYSSVTISNGATLTFANHANRAPVVWLVRGDVTINGTVSLDGQAGQYSPNLAEPGPGGFRGGNGYFTTGVGAGAGFGPGGGGNNDRFGGSYGTLGYGGSSVYGNQSLLPLIGGSGGAGDTDNNNGSITSPQSVSGGGGGGAILIACSGNLFIGADGILRADGGTGGNGWENNYSGGGSGGGVRIVCNTLSGTGVIRALAGGGYRAGGLGRIFIERVTRTDNLQITPGAYILPLLLTDTPLIWLPTNGPIARIVSIGSTNAPLDPRAAFGTYGADVTLPQLSTTQVVVETVNAEIESVVKVRVTPRANGNFTETTATLTQTTSSNPLILRWTADVPVNNGYSAIQARLIRP